MRLIDADALKDYYGKWSNNHTEFLKPEIDRYIDAQPTIDPESLRPKWISVEDRLPEDGELFLVLASGKPCENITLVDAYEMAEYSGDDNCGWILEMYPMWEDAKVTHWMPLPEMPDMRGAA